MKQIQAVVVNAPLQKQSNGNPMKWTPDYTSRRQIEKDLEAHATEPFTMYITRGGYLVVHVVREGKLAVAICHHDLYWFSKADTKELIKFINGEEYSTDKDQ